MDDINDILKVAKGADSIVLTFSVPKDTRFISWSKFNQYMINNVYLIEKSLDILDNAKVDYTISVNSDSEYYTALDVSEIIVGDDVIYNKNKWLGIFTDKKDKTISFLEEIMIKPTGRVVIIPSDNGNEYKFYTSEHKYYYVKPYCKSGTK